MKWRWHLKKHNTPKSRMFCGRNAKMNGGTARFTTTIQTVFLDNPCGNCLKIWKNPERERIFNLITEETKP